MLSSQRCGSKGIDHEGHVDKATPGRNEREVRHPKFIWLRGPELAVHLIQRVLIRWLTVGGFDLLAPPDTLNIKLAHQTFDRAAGNVDLLAFHCMPKFTCAID